MRRSESCIIKLVLASSSKSMVPSPLRKARGAEGWISAALRTLRTLTTLRDPCPIPSGGFRSRRLTEEAGGGDPVLI
ncbi:hypothetical protein J6590_007312 [Homalodisca vitripennis]|nr:hypothetical protein J6590_007312 [Homalodisca vitripennis]